tara:strand:- start:538 stop:1569 length:1032 start_codon:yes stop_codon:yes gene_type:complete
MRIIRKKETWRHVTFPISKIEFLNWAKKGVKIILENKDSYDFIEKEAIEALHLNINPSYNGPGSCYIEVPVIKSIFIKTKRKETIQLLNGATYDKIELLNKMYDDSFYYGELGKYALSSSAIKNLIDSPKQYARSLNYKTDTSVFKTGRLIHLAALEPDKLETLCHVVEVQSAVTKKYKDKVKEIGDASFIFTRKEYDKAMYTVDALLQNDVWQEMTRGAKFEQPGFDIIGGYPFRAKADVLGTNYIADLKTTSDLKNFEWNAKKYSYDVQLYIYCNVFKIDYQDFSFFAIDKSTGDLGIYDVTKSFFDSGKQKFERGLEIYEKFFVKQEEELNSYVIKGILN